MVASGWRWRAVVVGGWWLMLFVAGDFGWLVMAGD